MQRQRPADELVFSIYGPNWKNIIFFKVKYIRVYNDVNFLIPLSLHNSTLRLPRDDQSAMDRRLATQHEKHISFKRAYETLNAYLKAGEFLAAYVVAFSIVEDRIRTMHAKRYLREYGKEISDNKYNQGLIRICSLLMKAGDMTADEVVVKSASK